MPEEIIRAALADPQLGSKDRSEMVALLLLVAVQWSDAARAKLAPQRS